MRTEGEKLSKKNAEKERSLLRTCVHFFETKWIHILYHYIVIFLNFRFWSTYSSICGKTPSGVKWRNGLGGSWTEMWREISKKSQKSQIISKKNKQTRKSGKYLHFVKVNRHNRNIFKDFHWSTLEWFRVADRSNQFKISKFQNLPLDRFTGGQFLFDLWRPFLPPHPLSLWARETIDPPLPPVTPGEFRERHSENNSGVKDRRDCDWVVLCALLNCDAISICRTREKMPRRLPRFGLSSPERFGVTGARMNRHPFENALADIGWFSSLRTKVAWWFATIILPLYFFFRPLFYFYCCCWCNDSVSWNY